jgi:hypothetical protein
VNYIVVPGQPKHCCQIWHRLRKEHRAACDRAGADGHRELHAIFDQSSFTRAMFAHGKIIALGGVHGSVLSSIGFVWLALSEDAKRHPIAIVKEARKHLDMAMTTKQEVATTIIGGDEAAQRFAVFLGFHVSHEGRGQRAYSRFGRRDLGRYIDHETDLRISVGRSYAVNLGYHLEREH